MGWSHLLEDKQVLEYIKPWPMNKLAEPGSMRDYLIDFLQYAIAEVS
jgi:hypothetical protein